MQLIRDVGYAAAFSFKYARLAVHVSAEPSIFSWRSRGATVANWWAGRHGCSP
jgi:hypothetical protein